MTSEDYEDLEANWPMGTQFNLPSNATVVVAGAYKGRVMEYMILKYPQIAHIIGFEPQPWAFVEAVNRLSKAFPWRPIELYNFGLLAKGDVETLPLGEFGTDACSLLLTQREMGKGLFMNADSCLETLTGRKIDLFIMNVEGYERELLPAVVRAWTHVHQFAIQFHEAHVNYADAINQMEGYRFVVRAPDGSPIVNSPTWSYLRCTDEACSLDETC